MFVLAAGKVEEHGGGTQGAVYDDNSPDPLRWSSARVSTWLSKYKGGKHALLLLDDFFKNMDGEDLCTLRAEIPGIARQVLASYMCIKQAFQQLSSACNHGTGHGAGAGGMIYLVSGIVHDAISEGGWRQRLIRQASRVPARYVMKGEHPCVSYKGSDLHFVFAFNTEEAAYAWKNATTARKRPRDDDSAVTMHVAARVLGDVEIGKYVEPEDYDPKDTDSIDTSWDTFFSSPSLFSRDTVLSTGDNNEVFQYQSFTGYHIRLHRVHLIDKLIAEANELDGVNNQLGLPSSLQGLFDRCMRNPNWPPHVMVCLSQTSPTEPLPSDYGMQGKWDQASLLRAAKVATPPVVDPATVPAEPGRDQWVCGTGASEHVRHRVFLDVWFRKPDALWEHRSMFRQDQVLMATDLGLLRTFVYVRNPANFKLCVAWKLLDTLRCWARRGVELPGAFDKHWNLSAEQLRTEHSAVGWTHVKYSEN